MPSSRRAALRSLVRRSGREASGGRCCRISPLAGVVYAINPNRPTVLGRRCYPNLEALDEKPDLAVIVAPAATVPGVVRDCAANSVAAAVILSAGFKEVGPAGARLEAEVLAEGAREARMRIVGPNSLGVMVPSLKFNATFAATTARPGTVAFLSQSGALCASILNWSHREHVGFSGFVSTGSLLDVGWGDLIYHFGDDPHTRSIVLYMETIGDARSFLSAAREVALSKPVILIKVGRTGPAAKAASSHTGSMAGSDEVLDAACRRVGVLRVDTVSELFDMAEILGKQPRPSGPRLAIITNAGGPGVLATDMLVSAGARSRGFHQRPSQPWNESSRRTGATATRLMCSATRTPRPMRARLRRWRRIPERRRPGGAGSPGDDRFAGDGRGPHQGDPAARQTGSHLLDGWRSGRGRPADAE